MNTINNNENKISYSTPKIECVKLDNEISLALESTAPEGPDETRMLYDLKSDPYKQFS